MLSNKESKKTLKDLKKREMIVDLRTNWDLSPSFDIIIDLMRKLPQPNQLKV